MRMLQFILTVVLGTMLSTTFSCSRPASTNPPDDPQDTTQQDTVVTPLEPLTATIPVTDNWIWSKRPSITFQVTNPNDAVTSANLKISFRTDKEKPLFDIEKSIELAAKETKEFILTPDHDMDPGFYTAICIVETNVNTKVVTKVPRRFVFGLDPLDIVSAPDMQADFTTFWEDAKTQLDGVDMQAELTEIPSKSNANCKAYLVEFYSIPDGLSGDPVMIHGYYLEPQDGQKHPVQMHFYGYDTQPKPGKCVCPSGNGKYAEFYLSHRGQYINNRTADNRTADGKGDFTNIYGDWFAWHFGDKDSYYYRGAFMDCVQAVRFMATRETSDMSNLFAEGSSQGGALCYAAAALSDYPFSAIAPNVAFLGDYPDYFEIVSWPGNTAKENQGSMTDEEMYAFLSYFDTKNLATRISCPVWATSGLQDRTCPPHTNVAPFNNLLTTNADKQMNFYPLMTHDYPPSWYSDIEKFFQAHMK